MLNINPYLERFIFGELKAQYDPDPIAALHNLDNNEQQSQRYLGTYFPRSFVESYNIFYRLFNQEEIYKNFIGKKKINILNIGSGSGGDLFGLIEAMKDFFPLETIMTNIISIDGNVNAVSYQKKIYEQLYQNSNNHLSVMEQKFEDRYDFEEKISKILRNSNEQFDIILTFKFISEFYNRDYELNRGLYHSFIKQSYDYLTPEGMLIIEDVTNQIMENQKNNIFGERNFNGKIMNKEITDYMKQNNGKLGCLIPICCYHWYEECQDNLECFHQKIFNINHRMNHKDISKITYKVLAHTDFVDKVMQRIDKQEYYQIAPERYCINGTYHYKELNVINDTAYDAFSLR